ncbi:hypothetical protein IU501_28510 [Nocardia otitidiscaviarum]|uniref:hypothetical protein n=1 Tax=Nocardia otitidiscaviarum TaxID=1823 RepID=UPI001893A812|nr:hypothetical protein [Nocardia otitidiscaviarum]MBF6136926.1 hypothetical protein [Nocardia otitidiscaviarum]
MDLTGWLRGRMAIVPLLVVAPGATGVRVAVECVVRENGWRWADSPAAANLLIVAGRGDAEFEDAVGSVHETMPLPGIRVDIHEPHCAAAELAAARDGLRFGAGGGELPSHPAHLRSRQAPARAAHPAEDGDLPRSAGHAGCARMEHGGTGAHGEPDADDERGERSARDENGGHGHGGHGHEGMEMPGGLAMAERAADRDGLTLDEVTVSLGPVLLWWPAGLVVTARVQGGIVSSAEVSTLAAPEGAESFWLEPWVGRVEAGDGGRMRRRYAVARRVDSVATLLTVAGWEDAAVAGRLLRDRVLAAGPADAVEALGHRWIRRVRRSRTLRWSLRGVGTIADGPGAPPGLAGDTADRLDAWLTDIGQLLSNRASVEWNAAIARRTADFLATETTRTTWTLAALPELLTGVTLAEARLIVAGLDPDPDVLCHAPREVVHG